VLLKSQLAAIGVDVRIAVEASSPDFEESLARGSYEAWLATGRSGTPDYGYNAFAFYATDGINNNTGFSDPQVDRLADEILVTNPGPERDRLIGETQEVLAAAAPQVPLVETKLPLAIGRQVEGFRVFVPLPSAVFADTLSKR
jgi:peptide/nickel transport system substrate-binding protein